MVWVSGKQVHRLRCIASQSNSCRFAFESGRTPHIPSLLSCRCLSMSSAKPRNWRNRQRIAARFEWHLQGWCWRADRRVRHLALDPCEIWTIPQIHIRKRSISIRVVISNFIYPQKLPQKLLEPTADTDVTTFYCYHLEDRQIPLCFGPIDYQSVCRHRTRYWISSWF